MYVHEHLCVHFCVHVFITVLDKGFCSKAPPSCSAQHPFVTDFNERSVRIQIKEQIDRMKRKKTSDEFDYSGSDEEGGSLDPPTIKKQGDGRLGWGGKSPFMTI